MQWKESIWDWPLRYLSIVFFFCCCFCWVRAFRTNRLKKRITRGESILIRTTFTQYPIQIDKQFYGWLCRILSFILRSSSISLHQILTVRKLNSNSLLPILILNVVTMKYIGVLLSIYYCTQIIHTVHFICVSEYRFFFQDYSHDFVLWLDLICSIWIISISTERFNVFSTLLIQWFLLCIHFPVISFSYALQWEIGMFFIHIFRLSIHRRILCKIKWNKINTFLLYQEVNLKSANFILYIETKFVWNQ